MLVHITISKNPDLHAYDGTMNQEILLIAGFGVSFFIFASADLITDKVKQVNRAESRTVSDMVIM